MKSLFSLAAAVSFLCAAQASAQEYEIGGYGGFGLTKGSSITNASGSVSTGLKPGAMVGAFGGSSNEGKLGGEASYLYRTGSLKLSGNGRDASFGARTQIVDFRFLYHFAKRGQRVRPFVAIGGGVVIYSGTGQQSATQPLNSFAGFGRTREVKPMASGAVGVKYQLSDNLAVRVEFRDHITPFPDRLIGLAPGAKSSGWFHNLGPLVGVTYVF